MELYSPEFTYQLFAVRKDGLLFADCVMHVATHAEFVSQFDRLTGCNLQRLGLPIELAIDQTSGRLDHDIECFCQFVWDTVFTRLPLAGGADQPGGEGNQRTDPGTSPAS